MDDVDLIRDWLKDQRKKNRWSRFLTNNSKKNKKPPPHTFAEKWAEKKNPGHA